MAVFGDRLRQGAPFHIYGDGEQTRDFIYVKDVVEANLASIQHGDESVLHVSTGTGHTVNSLVDHISRLHSDRIDVHYLPAKNGDILHSRLNNERTRAFRSGVRYLAWKKAWKKPTATGFAHPRLANKRQATLEEEHRNSLIPRSTGGIRLFFALKFWITGLQPYRLKQAGKIHRIDMRIEIFARHVSSPGLESVHEEQVPS